LESLTRFSYGSNLLVVSQQGQIKAAFVFFGGRLIHEITSLMFVARPLPCPNKKAGRTDHSFPKMSMKFSSDPPTPRSNVSECGV
jgi:hypothetical protein